MQWTFVTIHNLFYCHLAKLLILENNQMSIDADFIEKFFKSYLEITLALLKMDYVYDNLFITFHTHTHKTKQHPNIHRAKRKQLLNRWMLHLWSIKWRKQIRTRLWTHIPTTYHLHWTLTAHTLTHTSPSGHISAVYQQDKPASQGLSGLCHVS